MSTRSGVAALLMWLVTLASGCSQQPAPADATAAAPPVSAAPTAPVAPETAAEAKTVAEAVEPPAKAPDAAPTAASTTVASPTVPLAEEAAAPASGSPGPRTGVPTFEGAKNEKALRYRFENGKTYTYKVHIEAEVGDTILSHDGYFTYSARIDKSPPPQEDSPKQKPTATAFVVQSDGYLLTCAHVVADAKKLEAAIGGKSYAAKVLGVDKANDLALIRIEAKNLPTVPLTNSDSVEVGEDVRAIGFPLSSLLGDSLKATRGTVSGIDIKRGQKLFQVDASINPGNSGGPVVNERGEVVGIASAKLAGHTISNVGFAVPVNYAKRLLGEHKVQYLEKQGSPLLPGRELVRNVSPAVALVTVTGGGGGSIDEDRVTLTFRGSLSSQERAKQQLGGGFGVPRFGSARGFGGSMFAYPRFQDKNELQIDAYGNILNSQGGESLPYMLGNNMQLMIEPLSPHGEEDWSVNSVTSITEKKNTDSPFGPGFMGRSPFARPNDDSQVKVYAAAERVDYALGEETGDTVVIEKSYELKTETKEGGQPYLQSTGKGDITFDSKQGLPRELSYKGTVTVNKDNVTVRIPLTLTYKLITGDAAAAAALAAASNSVPGAAGGELSKDELDKLLADLKTGDNTKEILALSRLATCLPTADRRPEVAKAIAPLVKHNAATQRHIAVRALSVWGGPDDVPALVEQMKGSDVAARNYAMQALGKIKDERAIEPLLDMCQDPGGRSRAILALEQFGSAGEKGLVKLLQAEDWQVRLAACNSLLKVGTKESVAALEAAVKDSNRLVSAVAQQALKASETREPAAK